MTNQLSVSQTANHIEQVLKELELEQTHDISRLIENCLKSNENNVHFFVHDQLGKDFFFKASLVHLYEKPRNTGIRARMNLENEVRFYRHISGMKFENLVIPRLFASSIEPFPYLAIDRLSPEEYHIFPEDFGFDKGTPPDFFAEALIKGIQELQKVPINQNWMIVGGTAMFNWLDLYEELFKDIDIDYEKLCKKILATLPLWERTCDALAHADIVPDTIGYHKETKLLLLLDFEKVQVSHKALDFSAFVKQPTFMPWVREELEPLLWRTFGQGDFKTLYESSKALRMINRIGSFKSGRLDYVFNASLGRKRFKKLKQPAVDMWIDELEAFCVFQV